MVRSWPKSRFSLLAAIVARIVVLLVPAALLCLGVVRTTGSSQAVLVVGAAFQLLVCVLTFVTGRSWRQPLAPSVITLYLISLGWLWLGASHLDDWYPHFAQAVLLIVPLAVFAFQALSNSGAPVRRRAVLLAERLARRKDWPADLLSCRNLPEVKAFREALHGDATPGLKLLFNTSVQVQVAALAALEFRKNWRPGQAELVLGLAQRSPESAIRAAAVSALANVDDRVLVEALAGFLCDPSRDVRRAATEAVLWDSEHRWSWIRLSVRQALADPAQEADGPLQFEGQTLPDEAVTDLNGWASEKGILAVRANQTLGAHYARLLNEYGDEELVGALQTQLANVHTPPALRIELANLLRAHGNWNDNILAGVLDPGNPAPLRLIAAEALLARGPDGRALSALADIARVPNREIALATAMVVQRYLSVDLGLPLGQPLPALHTRQAAEVTRRVMIWAAQNEKSMASTS